MIKNWILSEISPAHQEELTGMVFNIIVGTPVANCEGGTSPIDETIGGTVSVQDTWSITGDIGFELGRLKIGAGIGWSESSGITTSESLTIHVEAGQQVFAPTSVRPFVVDHTEYPGSIGSERPLQ
jgi:hypothetical protein